MLKQVFFASFLLASANFVAQVGINTTNPDPFSALDISSETKGLLIPRLQLDSYSEQIGDEANALSLMVYNLGSSAVPKGFYYWNGALWIAIGAENSKASNFFYIPSIVLPTIISHDLITNDEFYVYKDNFFEVNLLGLFKRQFSTSIKSSENATLEEFITSPNDLYDYFVTYHDPAIFKNITVSEDGILKYQVDENEILGQGSFMNIALKPKQ